MPVQKSVNFGTASLITFNTGRNHDPEQLPKQLLQVDFKLPTIPSLHVPHSGHKFVL